MPTGGFHSVVSKHVQIATPVSGFVHGNLAANFAGQVHYG